MKKRRRLSLNQKRMLMGYIFILPWLIGFIYFYVRSIAMTIQLSFSELVMDILQGGYSLTAVGFENYRHAFLVHGSFNQILTTSILGIIIDIPMIIMFSLFMAMLLNRKFRGRALIRVVFFLPIIMASDAIAASLELSAQMMSGGITSTSTITENVTGAVNIDFFIDMFITLGIPFRAMSYVVGVVMRINAVIAASGVQIIIFLAALQAIPGSLYEVADIEGATGYETFWKVTFPLMMPHIITNIVYTVVDSFTRSYVVTLAYDTAFTSFNYGLSSVFSIVSTLITLLILFAVVAVIQKRTFYYT
ncbi:MAG: sugar ABC transporter permease [Lachnospiraceae bacterium]|nr:sugar ABC transporter permease [Lachnospiraceae bacterium]